MSLDDVKVHRNSDKPAQLQAYAYAYAQGSDIHLGPGQEKYLPHELGHVIQQKENRVKFTVQIKGKVNVNDDNGLENRTTTEALRHEKYLFLTKSEPYHNNNPLHLLVSTVETLISKENTNWAQYIRKVSEEKK
jgi:hypothetical protein